MLNRACCGLLVEAVAEHQSAREDLGYRVCDVLAGDVRSGAACGLIEAEALLVEACGRQHAHGARDHCALVGEDVAEHVGAEQDVELRGVLHNLHGGVVDVKVAELNLRIVLCNLCNHLAPEDGALKDVGLVDGGDLLLALHGRLEGDPRNALDLIAVVDLGIVGNLLRAASLASLGLAEVDSAGELPYDDHVEAVLGDVGAERGEGAEAVINPCGAEVAEQLEVAAQRQERAALGPLVGGKLVPLRAADRAEEDRVRLLAGPEGILGKRRSGEIDGCAADRLLGEAEGNAVKLSCGLKSLE